MLRYKALIILALSLAGRVALAQELFVYSEPASNMPKKSLAIRMTNWLMRETAANRTNYHPGINVGRKQAPYAARRNLPEQ
jgi:hypothetical protein